jgi:hypothetical protein
VLVLSMHEDDVAVFGALRAGACGYLLKDSDRDDIVRAVLAVAAGEAVYGGGVARRIVDFFTESHQRYTAQTFPELTAREREVLDLVAAGPRQPRDRPPASPVGLDRAQQRGRHPRKTPVARPCGRGGQGPRRRSWQTAAAQPRRAVRLGGLTVLPVLERTQLAALPADVDLAPDNGWPGSLSRWHRRPPDRQDAPRVAFLSP